ncbi:MAG: IS1595 family transposase, partial [Chloroflexi bacterium]|nr:IS1595 family transposase [Chloroflexota bacterium]
MSHKAPGKSHREGISLLDLTEMFPDEAAAIRWFEAIRWPDGRRCGHCGSVETREVPNSKPMPYWCKGCRSYFSVRTGTAIEKSRLPLRKWVFAIYLNVTSLKSVSSMKLHRDLKVTQKTSWFMQHRLREAWAEHTEAPFSGPVEVDETYIGGKRRNMSNAKRKELADTGRGAVGKAAVVGAKDRLTNLVSAQHVERTDAETLQGFVEEHAAPGAKVYTDEAKAYTGMPFEHETVRHSIAEYVRGQAHTNGMESFWSMFKRAYHGTFHHVSPKHLQRYVAEFATKHNIRDQNTIDQMNTVVAGMVGRRLLYRDLV